PDTLKFIGAALYEIENQRLSILECYNTEKKMMILGLEQMKKEATKSDADKNDKKFTAMIEESITITEALIKNEEKPYWERRPSKEIINQMAVISKNIPYLNYSETGTRESVMLARMRMLQILCAERLEMKEAAAQYIDPFTGQPLKITPQLIYSL